MIAHRGASRAEPENTIAAFIRAVEMGAEGVELDVRRTQDDCLVVHHDAYLGNGRPIRQTPACDLPESVPSLRSALDACEGAFVNIEIKNDPTEPDFDKLDWVAWATSLELVRRGADSRWLISSFRLETIDVCKRLMPAVRTAWLVVESNQAIVDVTRAAGHDALHPWVEALDESTVKAAHRHGLAVNTWTCDDVMRIRELIAWGVDGVCTNVPDIALAVRRDVLGSAG